MANRALIGFFSSKADIVNAAREVRSSGFRISDAFIPFPIHDLAPLLDIRSSRIPVVMFVFALLGCASAFGFQYWSSVLSWPINVGGKPFHSFPAFIPVAFELTVLVGGISGVVCFFLISGLFPGNKVRNPFEGVSNDRFALSVLIEKGGTEFIKVKRIFENNDVIEIKDQELN